ncbi:MAG: serine hydrolase domain-containing protein, partial [Gemmatimonadaceae bacterium]
MHFRRRRRSWIGAACLAAAWGAALSTAPALVAQDPGPAVFDSIGAQSLANARAPGFSVAIVRHGRIVYARGFGFADLARKTPVAATTRFAIGSLSKQFAAAAILRLVERDSLSLDDHLADFLPAMPNAR